MKAVWRDAVIAESDATVVVEGNHYFPKESVNAEYIKESSAPPTSCAWKGRAHYYDIVVNGATNVGAAWCYAEPKPEAAQIKDRVAFWKGVEVIS
jgi:uncharacterized protein (DUF427 family)